MMRFFPSDAAAWASLRGAGIVVDDEGQPLPDSTLAAIAEQVGEFYREMAQAGIPAGSPLAQRLFA